MDMTELIWRQIGCPCPSNKGGVMPRRKLARRFDPGFGVSKSTLQVETKFVSREFENHLLWSTNDLRRRLKERQTLITTSEAHLQLQIQSLPERESLAIRCMI